MSKFGLLVFFCLVFATSAWATDERYAVEIKVDVTDESAAAAQRRAMSEANRAAVVAVAKRITT